MLETSEQIQSPVLSESPVPEIPQPDSPAPDESALTAQIVLLWQDHNDYQTSIKCQSQNLGILRSDLGKLLYQMKTLLAKPGRAGGWSAWLKQHQISRATADRLVIKHERLLNPEGNRLPDAITEPTEEDVQKLFHSISPRLRRVLRTPSSIYSFIAILTASFGGIVCVATDEGILVVKPDAQPESPAETNAVLETSLVEPADEFPMPAEQSMVGSPEELATTSSAGLPA